MGKAGSVLAAPECDDAEACLELGVCSRAAGPVERLHQRAALFEAVRDLERWATRWVMNSGPREVTQ